MSGSDADEVPTEVAAPDSSSSSSDVAAAASTEAAPAASGSTVRRRGANIRLVPPTASQPTVEALENAIAACNKSLRAAKIQQSRARADAVGGIRVGVGRAKCRMRPMDIAGWVVVAVMIGSVLRDHRSAAPWPPTHDHLATAMPDPALMGLGGAAALSSAVHDCLLPRSGITGAAARSAETDRLVASWGHLGAPAPLSSHQLRVLGTIGVKEAGDAAAAAAAGGSLEAGTAATAAAAARLAWSDEAAEFVRMAEAQAEGAATRAAEAEGRGEEQQAAALRAEAERAAAEAASAASAATREVAGAAATRWQLECVFRLNITIVAELADLSVQDGGGEGEGVGAADGEAGVQAEGGRVGELRRHLLELHSTVDWESLEADRASRRKQRVQGWCMAAAALVAVMLLRRWLQRSAEQRVLKQAEAHVAKAQGQVMMLERRLASLRG